MFRRSLAVLMLVLTTRVGAQEEPGFVSIIHGIPGVTVDVYVNGELFLEDFAPKTVTDVVELPAGEYDVAVTLPDADPAEAIISGSFEVVAGVNASAVAHLTADGDPTLSVFVNDLSPVTRKNGRLVVRHTAAAPAVDVLVARRFLRWFLTRRRIEGLENGQQAAVDLRRGTYRVQVIEPVSREKVLGPARLRIERRQVTIVYAIGSASDDTLDVVVQTLTIPEPVRPGLLSVVHGVPGLTVDVFVNGELALEDFEPETITDPLELPAGDYEIAVSPADAGIENAVIEGSATLPVGVDATVVAHLDADGQPTLSLFENDLSRAFFIFGRLVVRHVAAAPAVDVQLLRWRREAAEITDLMNGEEFKADVFLGRYLAEIFPAGGDDPVFGPVSFLILPRRAVFVYAIGSLEDGSFTLLTQTRTLSRH